MPQSRDRQGANLPTSTTPGVAETNGDDDHANTGHANLGHDNTSRDDGGVDESRVGTDAGGDRVDRESEINADGKAEQLVQVTLALA